MRRRYPHRIDIQKISIIRDPDTGEMREEWGDYLLLVPAHIKPISGREFIAASSEQSEIRARIEIRYRDDISTSMRAIHKNKIYNIHAVLDDNDTGYRWTTLMCSEGVNHG